MAETSKVTRMSDHADNCLFISPEQAISDLQKFLKENPDFDKVFLIAVSTKNQEFDYYWLKGRILSSEAIAAMHFSSDDLTRAIKG
ncbi:hypothetical protein KAW18_01165 [candidate division WOR-3 bacterium]|nr:hypothetical protein [candidate division WOR-3 bacterium]